MALYDALRQTKSHPTAEELYQMVQSHSVGLSRATVYNTLEVLCNAGLALRLPTVKGCRRYDADTSEHLHLRLGNGTEIRDIPVHLGQRLMDELPKGVLRQIESSMGVTIDGISIQLLGRQNKSD